MSSPRDNAVRALQQFEDGKKHLASDWMAIAAIAMVWVAIAFLDAVKSKWWGRGFPE